MKLEKLRLINFGGYKDTEFNFSDFDPYTGNLVKPLALFFGPNGIGKSTILEAIKIVSNPQVFENRQQTPEVYLRSLIRDEDYNIIVDNVLEKTKNPMRVEALFRSTLGEHRVVLTNTGFEVNELPKVHGGCAFYVDADHPINWSKFQLIEDQAKKFVDLAEAVFGFKVDLDGEVTDTLTNEHNGETLTKKYYGDFILEKGGSSTLTERIAAMFSLDGGSPKYTVSLENGVDLVKTVEPPVKRTKVHFSRMSAGEKKLATLIRMLCNPDNLENRDIILIDNVEMHVYYKRHAKMIDKLMEFFPDKQIICTTHSSVMISHVNRKYRYDLETYRPEYKMLDDNIAEEVKANTTVNMAISAGQDSLQRNGFVRHERPDGSVIYGPAHLAMKFNEIDDDGTVIREYTVLDRILEKAILIDSDNNTSEDPVKNEFVPTTPPAVLEAARIKREMQLKASRRSLWKRFTAGLRAFRNGFGKKYDAEI